jgi:hypothetical protein
MVVQSRKRHQMRHLDVFYRLLRDQEVHIKDARPQPYASEEALEQKSLPRSYLLLSRG